MISRSKIYILLLTGFIVINCCYAQQQQGFYNKWHTYDTYKKSMVDCIGQDTLKSYRLRDFMQDITDLDTVRFYAAMDTLKAYDKGRYADYQILFYYSDGEYTSLHLIIRGYAKDNRGREVWYYIVPTWEEGIKPSSSYKHNKQVFAAAYKNRLNFDPDDTNSILFISMFKKGHFETEMFNMGRFRGTEEELKKHKQVQLLDPSR